MVHPFREGAARGLAALAMVLTLIAGTIPAEVAAAEAMVPDLTGPWPANPDPSSYTEQAVGIPSNSPFTMDEVGAAPPTMAQGRLFLPAGASAERPVPAAILLHGAGGVISTREPAYARQLAAQGVAALVIDVFAARRDMATGFVDRLVNITEAMILADAYAGLGFLDRLPAVDGGRVAMIGFSYGGMAALYAAYAQVAESYAPGGPRFAAHVAYYAPCIVDFADQRVTGAPVLMLHGTEDALIDPQRCDEVLDIMRAGGAEAERIAYEGAVHQWDGRFHRRPIGRNLAPCRFYVSEDGSVSDGWGFLPMCSPFMRKVLLGLCTDSEGYLIGRDDEVRVRALRDLGRFLTRVYAGAGS